MNNTEIDQAIIKQEAAITEIKAKLREATHHLTQLTNLRIFRKHRISTGARVTAQTAGPKSPVQTYLVTSVKEGFTPDQQGWAIGQLVKKDGSLGTARRQLYTKWEVVTEGPEPTVDESAPD